ncbi:M23 family metallopeptidase [Sulfuriflexus sp.]|uniref:M23 family metallopeptidase n=1 Tax=Sulfuriflexus sp. TaxID=2015443 RepID=UPI0028CC8AC3|nr:peptidoglycan DD-metalloendopeptidase family protein [Sulfuriflexus sp.]MDT8404329.1 peptidoglycan DD-metalloendopeptidase family protein [Sulfuriflexus sp.]
MNIVFLSQREGRIASLKMNRKRWFGLASGLLLISAAAIYAGYEYGRHSSQAEDPMTVQLRSELENQRQQLDIALENAERNMNALSRQLGKMQARVIRLDALGQRLTSMAKLDKGEFDFAQEPAIGGPESAESLQAASVPDFMQQFDDLSRQLDNRSEQLSVLETMLMSRNLQEQALPSGRPIRKGWISSYYGMRNDPFTGKREHHDGVDLAGKDGSEVIAVASGVVTWSSRRYGYGNLVEVNHGNGYVTRYGHNKEVLVKVGDKVGKGDKLALMGSTGRSTGPHVHFEVLFNGRSKDPVKYINAR